MSLQKVNVICNLNDDPNVLTFDTSKILKKRKSETDQSDHSDNKDNHRNGDLLQKSASQEDDFEEPKDQYENYFIAHSHRAKTSGRTLSDLFEGFHLTEAQIAHEIDNEMSNERNDLRHEIGKAHFKKWFQLLRNGFNVMLYGVGSKKRVMETFKQKFLNDEHHIVIHGFFPEITVKHIINCLNQAMDGDNTDESLVIADLKEADFDIYLIINSIDRLCSGSDRIRVFLNQMVSQCPNIHIIASVDHANSGLLWSSNDLHAFKWLWFNVPTFDSYTIERAYQASGSSKHATLSTSLTQTLTLSSVQHVFDSLNTNAQQIFISIVKYYMNNPENTNGFPFSDCYRQCREEFLVNSEMTLRAQLSEFKDHKLLRMQKGSDGEVIQLLIDKNVAQRFCEKNE